MEGSAGRCLGHAAPAEIPFAIRDADVLFTLLSVLDYCDFMSAVYHSEVWTNVCYP